MKPEKLVEACTTDLEQKELAWALSYHMGVKRLIDAAHDQALEGLPQSELRALAIHLRTLADSIEAYASQPELEIENGRRS